jgi:phytoene dehydrogenase-like protein
MADNKYDVIIIGGGLAGLSTAAHLAKAGKKVVLFEQQDRLGGYCTSFERQGIIFNPAAHWTTDPDKLNAVLSELGAPPVKFSPMKSVFRVFGPAEGSDILLTKDAFVGSVLNSFPTAKKESLVQFMDLSLKIDDEMSSMKAQSPELMSAADKAISRVQTPLKLKNVIKYGNISMEKFLFTLFPGDALDGLRDALHVMVPMSGAPAAALLAWASIGFRSKAVVPNGGAQKITAAFVDAVMKQGGKVNVSQKVNQIKVSGGHVSGVVLADGHEFDSDRVVSTIDARQTFNRLLTPELTPQDYRKKLNSPVTSSVFTVSIVTDLDPTRVGFDGSDIYTCFPDFIKEMENLNDIDKVDFRLRFPTLIDPEARSTGVSAGLHGMQVLAIASFQFEDNWRTGQQMQRGKEYRDLKKIVASRLLKRVDKYLPGISDHVIYIDIATPITYHRYTQNHQGANMGWRHFAVWKQKIPFLHGLFHAGHWVNGVTLHGAIASGKTAAELILRDK